MDRIWQWVWGRYGVRYSWAIWVVAFATLLPTYLVPSFVVVAIEESGHYVEAAAVTFVGVLLVVYVLTNGVSAKTSVSSNQCRQPAAGGSSTIYLTPGISAGKA
jgi:hypothetical protein